MTRFRKSLARLLAKLALMLDPECPEVISFYTKQMLDTAIRGATITRIDLSEFLSARNDRGNPR